MQEKEGLKSKGGKTKIISPLHLHALLDFPIPSVALQLVLHPVQNSL